MSLAQEKSKKRLTSQHRSACPSTLTALIHPAQASKEILFVHTRLLCLAQLIRKDVQHELTITIGVDVSVCLQIQIPLEFRRIDEVSIVGEADTIRTVHIERLRFSIGTATSSRVAQVTDAHRAGQVCNLRTILEDLGCHAIGLQLVDPAPGSAGRDTGCILATVCVTADLVGGSLCVYRSVLTLKQVQGLVEVYRGGGRRICQDQSDDATHVDAWLGLGFL